MSIVNTLLQEKLKTIYAVFFSCAAIAAFRASLSPSAVPTYEKITFLIKSLLWSNLKVWSGSVPAPNQKQSAIGTSSPFALVV